MCHCEEVRTIENWTSHTSRCHPEPMDRPEPPNEAALIRHARLRANPKLSIRGAASLIDLSEARWRQIESGYQTVRAGERSAVIAPANTLASMAAVVGVTPDQLRKVDRADAADELEALERAGGYATDHLTGDGTQAISEAARAASVASRGTRPLRNSVAHTSDPLTEYAIEALDVVEDMLELLDAPEGEREIRPDPETLALIESIELMLANMARHSSAFAHGDAFAKLQDRIRDVSRHQTMVLLRRGGAAAISTGDRKPLVQGRIDALGTLAGNDEATEDNAVEPQGGLDQADSSESQADYDLAARPRRPGIPPEDDGGAGIGEDSQDNGNDDPA